ncbi:MAG: thiamine phosphate synthase [Rickettsiales bacterium]
MDNHPCRLYLISPPSLATDFAAQLEAAFAAGDVAAFQLRLKDADDAHIVAAIKMLKPICARHGVAFILNDRVDLVEAHGLDGVHLGQDDMPYAQARAALGEQASIGISCHDSKHLAMEAGEAGADYVAFGAFHATKSKTPDKLARYGTPTIELLEWWAQNTTVPCVAIGGMTPQNCGPHVAAGVDFIAAITAVWEHAQGPGAGVRDFNAAIRAGLKQPTRS